MLCVDYVQYYQNEIWIMLENEIKILVYTYYIDKSITKRIP